MNRIFDNIPRSLFDRQLKTLPAREPRRRSVAETKRMLREIAFVLEMTRRVKADMLESSQLAEPATV
ncbi:MAG: hypothetical protein L0Y71_06755 [Gemmataceae bacterium]|nr:hypothetical protein [Gemmataceae bacterium]